MNFRRAAPTVGLVLLVLLLGTAGTATSSAADADRLWVRYTNGAEYSGTVTGSCDASGFRFRPATPATVQLSSDGGRLVVYETWSNDSWVAPGSGLGGWLPLQSNQRNRTFEVSAGPLEVSWNRTGAGILTARRGGDPLEVSLSAMYLRTERVRSSIPSAFEMPLYVPGVGVAASQEALEGPARLVVSTQREYDADGDAWFAFHTAHVVGPSGFEVLLPPYKQVRRSLFLPLVAAYEERLFTHAELYLRNPSFHLQAASSELACTGFAATIDGGALYHNAFGAVQRRGERHDFSSRELALSGYLEVAERIERDPGDGLENWTLAVGGGRFDAAGIDFTPLGAAPPAVALVAPIGAVAVIMAVLLVIWTQFGRLVGFFYSRVDEGAALRHPTRSLLIQHARARPGVILKDLVAATGRPYGVVRHHARVLERLHLVRTLRRGSALHLYPADASIPAARRRLLLETDESVRYAVELVAGAPKTFRELGSRIRARFGFSRMGSWKVLRRAERAGLLRRLEGPNGVLAAVGGPTQ